MMVQLYRLLKARSMGMALLLLSARVCAQQATLTLSSPNTSGTYTATQTIVLNPGFSASGTTGFHAYISPLLVNCNSLGTPSAGQNYVQTLTPRQPFTDPGILLNQSTCEVMQNIQYIDGLGRPLQTVQVKGSPDATKDVVQPFAYDAFGRESIKYLPYTTTSGTSGNYRPDALIPGSGVFSFYNPTSTGASGTQQGNGIVTIPVPSLTTVFEPSPLNRVLEQGAPGDTWQPSGSRTVAAGRTVVTDYRSNNNIAWAADPVNSMQVALYTATLNTDGTRTLGRANGNMATYGDGQLTVTIVKDENWTSGRIGTVETYTNKAGHTLLKRTYNYNTATSTAEVLSTYYVYDDLGELAFVLPPGVNPDFNTNIDQTALNTWCYQYQYDERKRLVGKRIPGKDWNWTVYNQLDKPVATQDGNQRNNQQWIIVKYDVLGRPVMSGIWNSASDRPTLQGNVNAQTIQWENRDNAQTYGYTTSNTYPNSLNQVLSVKYYDDYNIPNLPAAYDQHATFRASTRGLPTAALINVLGSSDMLWMVNYYDDKGQVVQTYKQHYLGGVADTRNYDKIVTGYDFTGVVTNTTRTHYTLAGNGNPALTIGNTYVYDHMGRKRQTWEQINGGANTVISQEDYNDLGQLLTKHLHSTDNGATFLQNISYLYNERGWLNQSSAPLFEEFLQYNNTTSVSGVSPTPQYNGNIASQSYGTAVSPNTKSFVYTYDALNRLTSGASTEGFAEQSIQYDYMGNITSLNRVNPLAALNSTYGYSYNGNQLQSVSGLTNGTYSYDPNGNMLFDARKGNTISYNLLNLPNNVNKTGLNINYTYDASGQKLRKDNGSTVTDYISGIQYDNGTITFVQTDEGRALNLTGSINYEYSLTDHLGNSRVTFDSNGGGSSPKQTDDYMPFGMEISRSSISSPKDEYLYNKKELQEETGQYDYGARFYDPVIGRWTSVDPLAETSRRWSPYNYGDNSPIRFIDPDGMEVHDEVVGADGLTTDQWIAKTRPGSSPRLEEGYRQQNWLEERNKKKKKASQNTNVKGGGIIINGVSIPIPGMEKWVTVTGHYDLSQIVVGYQLSGTATATAADGTSGNVYKASAMFLGGPFKGYWYDYGGIEGQVVLETAAEATVGISKSYFIAFHDPQKIDSDNPLGFAGGYHGGGGSAAWKPFLGSVNISGQYSISNDGAWRVFSIGASVAFGPSVGFFDTFSGGGEAHMGTTRLFGTQIPTSKRSYFDIGGNWFSHLFLY